MRQWPNNERGSLYGFVTWQCPKGKKQKKTYTSSNLQIQIHSLIFIVKKVLLRVTSSLSRQSKPMAQNITAALDTLLCTNYVDFGNCRDKFGRLFRWKMMSKTAWMSASTFSRNMTAEMSDSWKLCKTRNSLQKVYETTDSASCCSKKQKKRRAFVFRGDSNKVCGFEWTTYVGSQVIYRCGLSKQKDLCDSAAVHCGQAREVRCSNPTVCKEEKRKKISANSPSVL